MIDLKEEKPITLTAVAQRFGVSLQTVRNWTNNRTRQLETVRMGRLVFTTWEALQRFAIQSIERQKEADAVRATIRRPQVSATHEESVRRLRALGLDF